MNITTKRKLLQLFFPSRCPLCDSVIHHSSRFCSECRDKLIRYEGNFSIKGASGFTAAFVYDENVLPAISLLKNGICDNADFALGGELADTLSAEHTADKADLIIPVPMHVSKLHERTYNQAELIAGIVGRSLGIPVCKDAVMKTRMTADQKTLNRISRFHNLKNAFTVVLPEIIEGKNILLIDDICTTGSTLAVLTKLLLENNAASVHCAVCCKTPLKKKKNDT